MQESSDYSSNQETAANSSGDPTEMTAKGYQALSVNQISQAGACFKKALEIDQSHTDAWRGLGNVCETAKLYEDAMFAYQQWLSLDQQAPEAFRRVAAVCIQTEQYDQAIDALSHSLLVDPDQPKVSQSLELLKLHVAQAEKPEA